ncbi:transport and Golgi organization protein 1 homolog [Ctenodactylus gundi]
MAAAQELLLLLLLLVWSLWRVWGSTPPDRRFTELKLCADAECSMLMYRGEALDDFTGPDCRFVNFKKGDPVYVYYKLAGGSPELWAGSVGQVFGYFPKDLIRVKYEYAKEELQVPTDETDFVCFDEGREDFDNYNIQHLLGFLDLYDSAPEGAGRVKDTASPQAGVPPTVSQGGDPGPPPQEADARDGSSVLSEDPLDLEGQGESPPHAGHPTDGTQGQPPSLQEKLRVPESDRNRTNNSPQVSLEQEKADAHTFSKREVTVDLKTKFGSTADASVSDDEATGRVTSLEDDFDEAYESLAAEGDAEEEEGAAESDGDHSDGDDDDDGGELPLLTFIGGEEGDAPAWSGGEEQHPTGEDQAKATLPPSHHTSDKHVLTAWGDTLFSIVTAGDAKAGRVDSSTSEEEKEDGVLGLDGQQRGPQAGTVYSNPEPAEDGSFGGAVQTVDTATDVRERGKDGQDSHRVPVLEVLEPGNIPQEGFLAPGLPQITEQSSLPAAGKNQAPLTSASGDKGGDAGEVVIHVSKDRFPQEGPGGNVLEGGSPESLPIRSAAGGLGTVEERDQESPGGAPPWGHKEHGASGAGKAPAGQLPEGSREARGIPFQFSSPHEAGLPGNQEAEVPTPGENLSWPQGEGTAAISGHVDGKLGLPRTEEGEEGTPGVDSTLPRVAQGTGDTEGVELPDSPGIPGSRTGEPDVEEEEEEAAEEEELLEDENALSAAQSPVDQPGVQSQRMDANPQEFEDADFGTVHPDLGTKENKQTNMIWGLEKENAAITRGEDRPGRAPGNPAWGEDRSPAGEKVRTLLGIRGFPGEKKALTPGSGEVSQDKESGDLRAGSPEGRVNTSESAERPWGGVPEQGPGKVDRATDSGSPRHASAELEGDQSPHSPHAVPVPGLGDAGAPGDDRGEDWPIIRSFFKEQQSLRRFLKYFDTRELEDLLQDMSLQLQAARQDSLPYNVDKVLDKVFRTSEAQILSAAERMLDARVAEAGDDLGTKDSTVLEEAAVLDDVQDLIYFVRYTHPSGEDTGLRATAPPLEEGWHGPPVGAQPPSDDHSLSENTGGPNTQLPEEPGHSEEPVSRDMGTWEVSLELNSEEHGDPGVLTPEGPPDDVDSMEKQPEMHVEEPAPPTPLENTVLPIYSSVLSLPDMVAPEMSLVCAVFRVSSSAGEQGCCLLRLMAGAGGSDLADRRKNLFEEKESARGRGRRPRALSDDVKAQSGRRCWQERRSSLSSPSARPLPAPCEGGIGGKPGPRHPAGSVALVRAPHAMDSVPATVPSVGASPGHAELLGPLQVLCAAFLGRLLELVATLVDDVQPSPDFYGLPWKPVLLTAFLGVVSFVIFFWRNILVVRFLLCLVTEQQISEKLKNFKKENAELVQKLSSYEQKIKESKKYVQETKKQNMILSDEVIKYKDKIKTLEETNEILDDRVKSLHAMIESEQEQNVKNQDLILENKKCIEKLKETISVNASEFSEVQVALSEARLSEEKVKADCQRAQDETAKLMRKNEQLQQEIEDWRQSCAQLTEQMRACERSRQDLEDACAQKDENISALTNCVTQLNQLECESESECESKGGNESDELASGAVGGDQNEKIRNQIKQMMDVSRTQTAVSVVEEDLKCLQTKLRASMSTKCNLDDQIKKLEEDRSSLQSVKARLEDDCQALRQKVEILNELYQEKEMALQKKLSQEEFERQEKEQRLSAADEKVVQAAQEVKTYKRRIEEMEEELQRTERTFKSQIAAHEKKAHENWLKARAAERAMAEEKREAATLRHKLLEITQKLAMQQDEPMIVKPMPGRPNTHNPPRRGPLSQNGSFGPSPVSGDECSPPLSAEPPGRPLSATLTRREMPQSEFGLVDGPSPRPRWPSEASGKLSSSDSGPGPGPVMNSSSRSSSPAKVTEEGKANMAAKGPPPFPGVLRLGSPVGGPLPPPVRYGPPPPLCGPYGPRPLPSLFGPAIRPPLGLREYVPGIPPGRRDLPLDPREFLPAHGPFRPPGPLAPREYFMPGPRVPPPMPGPQGYPTPAAGDTLPLSPSQEPPPASPGSGQDSA